MFKRRGVKAVCVRCNKENLVHSGKNLVVGKDKVSIEFDCSCGQHNVMHMQVVRRRLKRNTPAVNVNDAAKIIPNERQEINPFSDSD